MNEGKKGYFDQEQVLIIPLCLPVLQGVFLDNREEAQRHREGEWERVRDWALAERCCQKTEVLQRPAFALIWVSFQVGQVWEHMGRICLFSGTFWFQVLSSSLLKSSASSLESPRSQGEVWPECQEESDRTAYSALRSSPRLIPTHSSKRSCLCLAMAIYCTEILADRIFGYQTNLHFCFRNFPQAVQYFICCRDREGY